MHTFTIPAGLSPEVAATVNELAERCANDPRPQFGLQLQAADLRRIAAGMRDKLNAGTAPAEMVPHWSKNSPKFFAAADALDAMAAALPTPPAPTREHLPFGPDGYGGAWVAIAQRRAEPDTYRGHVLECIAAGQAQGLYYNAELWPRAAAMMADRYGYPDARLPLDSPKDGHCLIGSHCYMAVKALDQWAEDAKDKAIADTLHAGQTFPRLMFSDYKLCTGAVLHSFAHTGKACRLTMRRGGKTYEFTCSATALQNAIERAAERAQRRAAERAHA